LRSSTCRCSTGAPHLELLVRLEALQLDDAILSEIELLQLHQLLEAFNLSGDLPSRLSIANDGESVGGHGESLERDELVQAFNLSNLVRAQEEAFQLHQVRDVLHHAQLVVAQLEQLQLHVRVEVLRCGGEASW